MIDEVVVKKAPKGWWLPVSIAGMFMAGCGALRSTGGEPTSNPRSGPDCTAWEGPGTPSLLAASADLRSAIRRRAEEGAIAVRFARSGCDLRVELLEACSVPASYTFQLRSRAASRTRLGQPIEVLDAAPIGGSSWLPLLEEHGAIGVERATLGALQLPTPLRLPVDALAAEACRGATHLISAIELGRFRVIAAPPSEVERVFAGKPSLAPGEVRVVAQVGDPDACASAVREGRPIIGCDEPIVLHLVAATGNELRAASMSPMLIIAAGTFTRGEDGASKDRGPARKIRLDAFEIDRFEVSAAEYSACVGAGACAPADEGPFCTVGVLGKERHPVNCIDYARAEAYCRFAKKRLPTEAEWEKAARGQKGALFEWGNEWPPPNGVGNFADETAARAFPYWPRIAGYADGHAGTAPVDVFGAEGMVQSSGNVAEWVADVYDEDFYRAGPEENPTGAKRGAYRIVRGGHFGAALPDELKLTRRDARLPTRASMYFGVRCARTLEPEGNEELPEGDRPPERRR